MINSGKGRTQTMKTIKTHIWGIIQLTLSVLLVIKWLSKPTDIGQLGQDRVPLYLVLTIIVTVISLETYLNRKEENIKELIPVFICLLTIIAIPVGSAINRHLEKNRKPVISASNQRETMLKFKDNTFEFEHKEAEYTHYDRGRYRRQANKLILDKQIFACYRKTNTFYISDTSLYIITAYPTNTIAFKKDQQ